MPSVTHDSKFYVGHFSKLMYTLSYESVASCLPAFRLLLLLPLATVLPRD
jgi:hypothetical protein